MLNVITSWLELSLVGSSLVLLLAAIMLSWFWVRLHQRLMHRSKKTKNKLDDVFYAALKLPVVLAICLGAATEMLRLIEGQQPKFRTEIFWHAISVGSIITIACFLFAMVKEADNIVAKSGKVTEKIDKHSRELIIKILQILIFAGTVIMVLQTLGIQISGILALGGAGTLILGLAAKDLLANLFGGLIIYLDQPFKVGDWVMSPEKPIEGIIETISWRRTSIRNFAKQPLYVPNSVFSSIIIQNVTRMTHRRINETIGIRYNDLEVLPAILEAIEQMLIEHPQIDPDQTIQARFTAYGASSLNFFVSAFTKSTVWKEFNGVKQDILLKIAAIVSKHGAEFAFPTTTIHIPEQIQLANQTRAPLE